MNRRSLLLAIGILVTATAHGAEPWLLAFPQISTNAQYAFFAGPHWTAVYIPEIGKPAIVPRDSLTAPAPLLPVQTVTVGTTVYRAVSNSLSATREDSRIDSYRLPPLQSDVLAFLTAVNAQRADTTTLIETLGPLLAVRGFLYFGLTLRDTVTGVTLGGIGWFNPASLQMNRLYSPALAGMQPAWILPRADTLLCIFQKISGDSLTESHVVRHVMGSAGFDEVNWQRAGIPGSRILNAAPWGDTLLLATDNAIALWKPQRPPAFWQTRAWASSEPRWLYLKTVAAAPDTAAARRFLLLRANLAVEVEAQAGAWWQVVAPFALEGYVGAEDWETHGELWSEPRWNCGERPCFARVRAVVKDELVDMDVTKTPLEFLNRDSQRGVKVRFRALWVRSEDLTPALLAP